MAEITIVGALVFTNIIIDSIDYIYVKLHKIHKLKLFLTDMKLMLIILSWYIIRFNKNFIIKQKYSFIDRINQTKFAFGNGKIFKLID